MVDDLWLIHKSVLIIFTQEKRVYKKSEIKKILIFTNLTKKLWKSTEKIVRFLLHVLLPKRYDNKKKVPILWDFKCALKHGHKICISDNFGTFGVIGRKYLLHLNGNTGIQWGFCSFLIVCSSYWSSVKSPVTSIICDVSSW